MTDVSEERPSVVDSRAERRSAMQSDLSAEQRAGLEQYLQGLVDPVGASVLFIGLLGLLTMVGIVFSSEADAEHGYGGTAVSVVVSVLVGGALFWWRRRATATVNDLRERLRGDLEQGIALFGIGEVVGSESGYVVMVSEGAHKGPLDATLVSLAPGLYRFSFAPRSRACLSGEPLGSSRIAAEAQARTLNRKARESLESNLVTAFALSRKDLDQARFRHLSSRLRLRLVRRVLLPTLGLLLGTLLVVSLVWTMRDTSVVTLIRSRGDGFASALGRAVAAIVFIASAVPGIRGTARCWMDLWSGVVERRDGLLLREKAAGTGRPAYRLRVDATVFDVSEAVYKAVTEGVSYRAFFTPRARILLGLVPE